MKKWFLFSQTWAELDSIGFDYYQRGKYKSAAEYYNKALDKAQEEYGAKSVECGKSLHCLGAVYMEAGLYEQAMEYYQLSLEIKEAVLGKKDPSYATTMNNMGTTCSYMGNYLDAEKYLLESMQTRKEVEGELSSSYASSLNNLGYVYQLMNRFEDSEKMYTLSLNLKEKNDGKESESYALALNNLGHLYMEMSRFRESEQFYFEAIRIREKVLTKRHPDYAMTLSNLGVLYDRLGSFDKSIALYEEAKVILEAVFSKTHPDYALLVNNLASSYKAINNFTLAEKYFLESIEINKKTVSEKSPYYAMTLSNLANLYVDQEKFEEAIPYYKTGLNILGATVGNKNPRYADMLIRLGVAYHRSNRLAQADSCYLAGYSIKAEVFGENHPEMAPLKNTMASLYWINKDIPKAKNLFLQSIESFYDELSKQSSFLSEMEMSRFLYDNGYYHKSFYSFCHYNYKSEPGLISDMNKLYSTINGKLLRQANKLKLNIEEGTDSTLVNKYNEWIALKKSINKEMSLPDKYRSEFLGKWETRCGELEKEITRSSNSITEAEVQEQNDWKYLQTLLKPDECLIEFISFSLTDGIVWTDSVIFSAMLVRPGDLQPIYIPLFEEKSLEGLLTGDSLRNFANLLYSNAQVRNVEHDISYGDSLYKLVWAPIMPYLTNVKHIYYCPTAELHTIAHQAIPIGESKVLSDRFKLERITTGSQLSSITNSNFSFSSVSMFGGLNYEMDTTQISSNIKKRKTKINNEFYQFNDNSRGGTWSYLPGTKTEVENIYSILKKGKINVKSYSNAEGKEEVVKSYNSKNSPSVLHFSTHGFFFSDPGKNKKYPLSDNSFTTAKNPLFRSGLILSGGNYVWKGNNPIDGIEDGVLTAYEVSNLNLSSTHLVIMSACETGLGDIKRSEGIYGLQRAFKIAGVDYIIVTLWQVLDKETSEFMILFYQNLMAKQSITNAFDNAQEIMKNKYRSEPYKWAGFVLIY